MDLAVSDEKWNETKMKKFYQIEHPKLNKLISDCVKEYQLGGKDKNFTKSWSSSKSYKFKDLYNKRGKLFAAVMFKPDEDYLPQVVDNILYNDRKVAEIMAVKKCKEKLDVKVDKEHVLWENDFYIPVVITFDLMEVQLRKVDREFWNQIPSYKPFGPDEPYVRREFCRKNQGWTFEKEVLICSNSIQKIKVLDISVLDEFDLSKKYKFSKKIDEFLTQNYEDNVYEIGKRISKLSTKYTDPFRKKEVIEEYFEEFFGREISEKSNWLEDDFINRLNKYMTRDYMNDNWDIPVKTEEILKYLLQNHKTKWDSLKLVYQPEWENLDEEEKEDYLADIFDTNMNVVKMNIIKEKIGQTIATDMKDYCYIEIMKAMRPFVYETIKFIEKKIKSKAYIIIAGGEPMNQMLDFDERGTTTDVDTKIILKYIQHCKNYPSSYKDECVKFVNHFWYDVYPQVQADLEKKYPFMYEDLIQVAELPEMRVFGLSFINPKIDSTPPFKKRFSRLSRQQEVILITIDMMIKQMILFDKEFKKGEGNYSGFLDSPIIYNPYEASHLYHEVILAKPKDFLVKSRDMGIFDQKFHYISPEYAVHDTERLVRTQERPEKIEKDRKRFNQLMKKFGSEDYVFKYPPKIKDLTTVQIHKYSKKKFPKQEDLEIVSKCTKTKYASKYRDWKEDCETENCNPLYKILFNIISFVDVEEFLFSFAKVMVQEKVFPIFLEKMSNPEKVEEFLSTFYFRIEEPFKLSYRNLNNFKMDGEMYMCESNKDENCYDECSDSNQSGCNIFAFKDRRRLVNMTIGKESLWYLNYWIPFLFKVYRKFLREVLETKNPKIQRELLINLMNDFFTPDTELSTQEIVDYYLINFIGIQKYSWMKEVDDIVDMLYQLKEMSPLI